MSRHTSQVARLILTELERQHLTRTHLAGRMGRTPQYVTDILTGRKRMDPYLALQLEHILNRPALDFLAAALEDERGHPRTQAQLRAMDQNRT